MNNRRVLVTGATGFFGSHVCKELSNRGYEVFGTIRDKCSSKQNKTDCILVPCNLLNLHEVNEIVTPFFDYVLHLAGYNGGIQKNIDEKAAIFIDNTIMGLNLYKVCQKNKVPCISVVTSCAYDNVPDGILHESEKLFLEGRPHETVYGHGMAKRNLQIAANLCNQSLNGPYLHKTVCVTTLFGPGDHTDINRTKLVDSLIIRMIKAKRNGETQFVVWGSGRPMRQIIDVRDAAVLLTDVMEIPEFPSHPINIGSPYEKSVSSIVTLISGLMNYMGDIVFDTSKPDGQMRKALLSTIIDVDRYKYRSLADSIMETIKYYEEVLP